MRTATVTEAKNGLSALLEQVKAGERVLITDRGVPIAVVEPYVSASDDAAMLAPLIRAGLVRTGTGALPDAFFDGPVHSLPPGSTLLEAVLDERRSGW